MRAWFTALRPIARKWIKEAVVFRSNSILLGATALIQIVLVNAVWTAAYRTGHGGPEQPLDTLLVYVTLAGLQAWLLSGTIMWYIQDRITQGTVIFDLLRPISFLSQMGAHQVGATLAVLFFLLPALPIAFALGAISPPAGLLAGACYVLSSLLALCINSLTVLIIGMSAFWTLQIDGVNMFYRIVSQFFAGTMAPLTLFPEWLRVIAYLMPFQATTYTPIAIYVGDLKDTGVISAMAVQLLWVGILSSAVAVMWRRAVRKVVIQGG